MPENARPRRLAPVVLVCATVAGAARADASRGKLVFGGDQDFPPFEWLDEEGTQRGFNVELVRAMGATLGRDIEVRLGPWPEVRRGFEQEGSIDFVDLYESPAREQTFDFSEPIHIAVDELYVRVGSPEACSISDLSGRRVLVQTDAWGEEYLAKHHPGARALPAMSEPAALHRLSAGEGDCAIVSQQVGRFAAREASLDNIRVTGPPFNPKKYSFAVRKGRPELLAAINRGLADLKARGRYGELSNRFLGLEVRNSAGTGWLWRHGAWVLGPIGTLAIGALFWSWTLRRRVRERTRELAQQLAEKRRAVAALGESEQRFRTLVEHAPEAIFVVDVESGELELVNEKAAQLFGISHDRERRSKLSDLIASQAGQAAFAVAVERALAGERVAFEHSFMGAQGDPIPCDVRLVPLPSSDRQLVRASLADARERKRREARAAQSQRMESLGRLAGGIAHDFNNVLGVITAHGELLKQRHGDQSDVVDAADEILAAGERAAAFTRQLLAFGRRQVTRTKVVSPNALLDDMRKLLQRAIGEDIVLSVELGEDAGHVHLDPSQAEQIVMNLALNARDAMPDGGRLVLRTRREVRSEPGQDGAPAGDWLVLEVADTGIGIAPEIRAQIFEPFFSTKEHAGGTGLGLATVYGIAAAAGGTVTVESELGQGATFRVWLPRTDEAPERRPCRSAGRPPSNGELVLLVEDEEPLRNAVEQMLVQHGYRVVTAAGAAQAIDRFDSLERSPDLLLTDVVMPSVGGRELAMQLRERKPSLPVLFLTGHADDVALRSGELPRTSRLLTKPVGADQLLTALDALLAEAKPAEQSGD